MLTEAQERGRVRLLTPPSKDDARRVWTPEEHAAAATEIEQAIASGGATISEVVEGVEVEARAFAEYAGPASASARGVVPQEPETSRLRRMADLPTGVRSGGPDRLVSVDLWLLSARRLVQREREQFRPRAQQDLRAEGDLVALVTRCAISAVSNVYPGLSDANFRERFSVAYAAVPAALEEWLALYRRWWSAVEEADAVPYAGDAANPYLFLLRRCESALRREKKRDTRARSRASAIDVEDERLQEEVAERARAPHEGHPIERATDLVLGWAHMVDTIRHLQGKTRRFAELMRDAIERDRMPLEDAKIMAADQLTKINADESDDERRRRVQKRASEFWIAWREAADLLAEAKQPRRVPRRRVA